MAGPVKVEYSLFGAIEARVDGAVTTLGGPKQRCVLAVLLAQRGTVVSVDRLTDALWYDDPPAKALVSLRSYVSNLRKCLTAPDAEADSGMARLQTWPLGYQLTLLAGDRLDLATFEHLVEDGRAALGRDDAGTGFDKLTLALKLWRGTPFGEFADRDFAYAEVLRYSALRRLAIEARFDAALRLGGSSELIPEIEAALANDPVHEQLWAHLMLSLYRAGRGSDALGAFERARETLDREVGAPPGANLRALYRQIGDNSADLPLETRAPASAVATDPAARAAPALVGRTAELESLTASAARARAGSGTLVVVTGESGIGKTALADAVTVTARRAGMAVAWAAHPAGIRVPQLWMWIQILRRLGDEFGEPGRNAVRRAVPSVVDALVPEWNAADTAAAPGAAATGFHLFEGIVTALAELAAMRPLLLVVDDLHLADAASGGALLLLGARVARLPIQIVGTWTYFGSGRPVNRHLHERLIGASGIVAVRLRGIDRDAVGDLIEQLTGVPATPELAAHLWTHARGNPFYIKELVRAAKAGERPVGAAGPDPDAIPDAINAAVGRRLAVLDKPGRRALAAAAVIGPEFDVATLSDILDSPVPAVRARLRPAYETGLLDEHRERPGVFCFSHGLLRDAVLARIPVAERTAVHAAIASDRAAALATSPYEEAIAAADHAWRAGTELNTHAALEIHETVIQRALARSAYADIVTLAEHALQACRRLPAKPELLKRQSALWLHLAGARGILHGQTSASALAAVQRAFELGEQVDGRDFYGAAAMRCMMLCARGRLDEAEVVANGLRARYAMSNDSGAGVASHFVDIMITALRGDMDAMLIRARHMLAAFPPPETINDPTHFFHPRVYCWMGLMEALRGDRDAAVECCRMSLELARTRGDVFNILAARLTLVEVYAVLGVVAGTADAAAVVHRDLSTAGGEQWAACAKVVEVWARTLAAENADPAAAFEAFEAITADGSTVMVPFFLALLADIESHHHRTDQALGLLARARDIADATGEHVWDRLLSDRVDTLHPDADPE
ncbi:BTAD domain-containing putative transcriptional regulator [Nocardia aurantiaca]|uniref:AAA family ATPase n=1 Tax=Nocardia aurantiaca TaxID=2675850 RepID=A0A6I3KZS9_9NOCA|nr:BTAD domain-containing putative transcriptional regulator [Nocardia aurantiaca]MTE14508.1 AAA family ATPase [Nocardia aurantiaca]